MIIDNKLMNYGYIRRITRGNEVTGTWGFCTNSATLGESKTISEKKKSKK